MIKYPKIKTPFMRDENGTKKLITGIFQDEAVKYLKDCIWECTEKIDGTNIGVCWDGYNVYFQGRTESSVIPTDLLKALNRLFSGSVNEEIFEQKFGQTEVILFGEGYGGSIQKNKNYRETPSFILFDVYLPEKDLWLTRADIEDIAQALGIEVVPIVLERTLLEAVQYVTNNPKSTIADTDMEGLVCKPFVEMRDRQGNRIIVKVKTKDFV